MKDRIERFEGFQFYYKDNMRGRAEYGGLDTKTSMTVLDKIGKILLNKAFPVYKQY